MKITKYSLPLFGRVSNILNLALGVFETLFSSTEPLLKNKFARHFVPSFNLVSLNSPSVANSFLT